MAVTLPAPAGVHIDLATAIADRIAATALVDGNRCTWLGTTVELSGGERQIVHRTGEATFYDGDAGVAWALAQAGTALGRDDLRELARAGMTGALGQARRGPVAGLHGGSEGVATAALQAGRLLGDDELREEALELLGATTGEPSPANDLISGKAGTVLALVAAFEETGDERLLTRAVELGDVLAEGAERLPTGWAWPDGLDDSPGLCGLAHGASGVAWTLGELQARQSRSRFDLAIREALRYERSWFSREQSNWPDLRAEASRADGGPGFPAWWCHGAVGIGLARLRLHRLGIGGPLLLAEAGAALQASLFAASEAVDAQLPESRDLTLCHGLGGTIELFLTAHKILGREEHQATAHWLLERALATLGDEPELWSDGIGGPGGCPALMTGLAGTMLVLLRAAGVAGVAWPGLFPTGSTGTGYQP